MKRLVVLSVVLVALFALSCGSAGTDITLVNNGRDPIHPNGGAKLVVGASGVVTSLQHARVETITLDRMGATWATLEVTSNYEQDDQESHEARITITEPTYGTFEASCDNENIVVTVTMP